MLLSFSACLGTRRQRRALGRRISVSAVLLSLLAMQFAPVARAGNLILNANDAGGTSSFTNPLTGAAGGWSLTGTGAATAPTAGNTYEDAATSIFNYLLRTPADAVNYTFAGDSLQIDAQGRFILKETGTSTLTISNLILNGGLVDLSPAGTFTETLAGGITLNSGTTSTILAETTTGTFTISALIAGLGNVNFGASNILAGYGTSGAIPSLGTINLTAAETYTGATNLSTSTLNLNGANGALTATTALSLFSGTMNLDNSASNNNNRLNDAASVFLSGGNFVLKGFGTAGTNTTEAVGAILGNGGSTLTVSFGSTNVATLNATSLTHSTGNGSILLNGVSLGKDGSSAASIGRILVGTGPTLIGTTAALSTGINAASKNTQIVPFLVGEATSTTGGVGTASGTANTFVTYEATTGFRPLNPFDEFTQSAITTGTNTRIVAATTSGTTTAINSLLMNGANLTITDGTTLTVTSGAVLFASSNAIVPSATTGTLAFGAQEGIISAATGVTGTITGTTVAIISGSGGLTFSPLGTGVVNLASTTAIPLANITGGINKAGAGTTNITTTTASFLPAASTNAINVEGGSLIINDTVNTTFTNPLGTGTITITPGALLSIALQGNTASTFANNIVIANANSAGVAILKNNGGATPFSGSLAFQAGTYAPTVQLQNTNGVAAVLSISGGVTGVGNLQFNGTAAGSPITLSGSAVNNTGSLVNIGAGNNAATVTTISAAIGSNVTFITQAGVAPFTITGPITLGGDRAYSSSNTGQFTLANIAGTATAGNTQTITLAYSSTGSIQDPTGIISDGANGGKVAVVVNGVAGAGLVALGGASTYSGGTILNLGSSFVVQGSSTGTGAGTTNGPFGTALVTFAGGAIRSTTTASATVGNTISITADTTFFSSNANADLNLTLAGPVSLSGTRILTVNTSPTAASTGIFISGNITGVGPSDGLTKAGPGTLLVSGTNTYGGVTTINAGVLTFQTPASLPNYTSHTAGLVTVATGATAAFNVGTVAGFTNADIGNLANGTIPITFAANSFLGLDTTGATGGVATVSTSLSALPANAILSKVGIGTLILSGTNTYSNTTQITQGILNAAEGVGLSSNSNLTINGTNAVNAATFAPTVASFERPLGALAGQMQITGGNSGFTNLTGAPQTIDFGTAGTPAALTWGLAGTTFSPTTLVLNDTGATGTVNFLNPINLNAAVRTVAVNATGATLSGPLTGAAGGLTKTGASILNVTNVTNNYTGATTVSAGILSFNGGGGTVGSTPLPSGTAISLAGGTFQVLNDTAGTLAYGNVVNAAGTSTINVGNNGSANTGSTVAFGAFNAPATAAATATITTFTGSNGYTLSFASLALPGGNGNNTTLIANTNVVITGGVTNRGGGGAGNFDTLILQGTALGSAINGVIADKPGGSLTAGNYTPLTKNAGTGTWTLTAANTYTGATNISAGTLLLKDLTGTLAGTQVIGGSQVIVNLPGATLGISGNVTIGDGTATLSNVQGTVAAGTATSGQNGNISLLDTTINTLTIKGNAVAGVTNFLTLGTTTAAQPSVLSFDLGNSTTDQIIVSPSAISGSGKLLVQLGGATINLNQLATTSIAIGNYNLLSYAGETLTGVFTLGTYTAPAGEFFTLTNTGTNEILNVTAGAGAANAYFKGNLSAAWNTGLGTTATNFFTDFAGTTGSALPDFNTNVFFTTQTATVVNLNTTLGQTFTINSLNFTGTGSTGAANPVTVGGAIALTINAAAGFTEQDNTTVRAAGTGLVVQNGVTATDTISAPLVLGGSQAWINAGQGTLAITGGITGAFNLAINNNSTGVTTISTGGVSNAGTVTNSGTGAGTTTINSIIGTNVTGVTQNSAASLLVLSGANTFTTGLNVLKGTVSGITSSNAFGANTNVITLGATGGSLSATVQGDARAFANPIALGTTTGTLSLANSTAAGTTTFSGPITGTNDLTLAMNSAGALALTNASLNFNGRIFSTGTGAGQDTISSVIGANITAITQNNTSLASSLIITGANTAYAGTTTINSGRIDDQNLGTTNVLQALGTGPIIINGGVLDLRADGSGGQQVITTGNGTTGNNVTVGGTGQIDAQRKGATSVNNAFVFNNLTINAGNALNVTGTNGYVVNFVGTTTVAAGATFNPTSSQLNLLGRVNAGANNFNVTGTAATRLFNTGAGAAADSITGTVSVTGGVLQGFASAAGNTTAGSNSLGTATITLGGTTPTLRLTPSLAGGLSTAAATGLLAKGFNVSNPGATTAVGTTNYLGANQTITGQTGNFAYLNSANFVNTGNGPTVANLPLNTAAAFNISTSYQFSGLLNITTAGMYNFSTVTDDSGNLFVDGNAPLVTANSTAAGAFFLAAGLHVFSERMSNNGGNGTVSVQYQGPDTANALVNVPTTAFFNATAAQLATNFGNNITVAGATSATVDIAGNTIIGTVGLAGGTLNVTASGDVNTLTTGDVTVSSAANATSTLAPGTAVLVVPNISGSAGAGVTNTIALGGASAGNYALVINNIATPPNYTAGNIVSGAIADGIGGGNVALVKSGAAIWTLNGSAPNTYTGGTIVQGNGTLNSAVFGALILAKTPGVNAIPGGTFTIGNGALGNSLVQLGASDQIADSVVINWNSAASNFGYFELLGNNETVAGLTDADAAGVIENMEAQVVNTDSTLTLTGSGNYSFNGFIRNKSTGAGTGLLKLVMSGSGSQTLSGTNVLYTGTTTINSGTIGLTGTTAFLSPVVFGAGSTGTLQVNTSSQIGGLSSVDAVNNTAFVQNAAGTSSVLTINQAGTSAFGGVVRDNATSNNLGLTKSGAGTLTLNNVNTYTGTTTISAGTLALGNGGNLGATAVSVNGGTFAAIPAVTSATTALGSSLTLAAGTAFTMGDGVTSTANVTGAGTLAPVSGTPTILTFDIDGSSNGVTDLLSIGGVGTVGAGKATIFINGLGATGAAGNVYTFITAASGLTPANFTFGNVNGRVVFGNTSFAATLGGTATTEFITLGASASALAYFTGNADPTTLNATSGGGTVTNFATDITGATDLGSQPAAFTDVFFTAQTVTNPTTINTLGQDYAFNSLNFTSGAPAITINESGAFKLTLANGVNDASGSAAQTVNVPLILSAVQTFTNNSANLLTIGGAVTNGGFTLTTAGTGNITFSGVNSGTGGFTTVGTGTITLAAAQAYTGTTTIGTGTLAATADQTLTGGLTFGAAANAATNGAFNISTANATFAGALLVQTSSATANTITVGVGKTLTINNGVTIGPVSPTVTSPSKLTIGGGGAFVVTAAGGIFQVGGSTTATTGAAGDAATLDLTGLGTTTINLGTGIVRVNNPQGGNTAGVMATLLLPTPVTTLGTPITNITAANFNVGDGGGNSSGAGQINSVLLGTGLTTLKADAVNIGTGGRDVGSLAFAAGNGTILLRAANGTGRATLNIGTGGATTGVANGAGVTGNLVDFTGHSADLLIGSLTVGNQTRNASNANDFKFDAGTLDATTLFIGADTQTSANSSNSPVLTSTVTIGGGLTTIGTGGVQLGSVTNTSTGARSNVGVFNVTGGTVNIGTTGVFSVRLGNNTAASGLATATDTFSVTGGVATLFGDIVTASTTRTTSTLTLNGGTLDLGGGGTSHNIGGATLITNLNFQSGTLKNVAQINNGVGLTKTTVGTLILGGTNGYTGGTFVQAGILKNGNLNALPPLTVLTLGAVAGNTVGTYDLNGFDSTIGGLLTAGTGTPQTVTNNPTVNPASSPATLTVSNAAADTFGGVIADGTSTTALAKSGAQTLTLTGVNTYSGGTTINAGILSISSAANLGNVTGAATINAGTLQYTAGFTSARQVILGNIASTIDVQQGTGAGNTVVFSTGVTGTGALNLISSTGPGTTPGTLALLGSGTYNGGTNIGTTTPGTAVTLLINSASSMGAASGAATINNATLEVNTNGVTGTTAGGFSSARTINLGTASSAIKVDANQTYTLTGTVSGPGSLNATGPGTLILAGTANNYTGPTNISNGTVLVTNATGTSTGNGAVNVGTAGTLGGTGKIGGAINVNTGGIITAGNSATDPTQTGTLTSTAGTSTFNSGGTYNWKINNATGTAGQAIGWDLLSFSTLQVLSTSGTNNTFTIAIEGNNVQFNQDNTGNPYLFPIAVATTALTGFDASKFVLNTSNLASNDSGIGTNGGHFSLVLDPGNSNQIDLSYNAVPEPTSLGLLALGALAFLKRPTRRRKAA